MFISILVKIIDTVACIVFVAEEAVISVIDRVLEHNPDLEEALYRRAFDKIDRGCK